MPTRVLPTGTITFLFSDIEGSTRLVADVGPAVFRDVLETHNALLRAAIASHGGTERGTQGDSFLVMFPDATAAVAAAVDAQRAITGYAWPATARVHVRMGLHTGLGILGGDDYVGLDVNRAARIAAAAHGGQVLISDTTRALAAASLPPDVSVRELGEHTLRDVPGTAHLYQLVVAGLRADFPPIHAASAARPDLPERTSDLIGRARELIELRGILTTSRLVTLTGPGGTGKTSLAAELARQVADQYPGGVHWIPLSSITDPEYVPGAIAERLGVVPSAGRTPLDGIRDVLGERPSFLVLDNMEQLLPAAIVISELLQATLSVRIVVTSRAPLHLGLEQEYPVAPLAVPPPNEDPAVAAESPSVRLFLERAGRVRPGYSADGPELDAVVAICRRLDGLPLGIELAASRVGLLSPTAIAQRLASRLDLPGSGKRDAPERQRTLAATIAWSYDLLDSDHRRLFSRLSVFAGGGGLEDIEAVCGTGMSTDMDVLDVISVLVDHSLVVAMPGPDGLRIRLLETIRMFAAERLAEDPADKEANHRRHALAYLKSCEVAAAHLPGRDQVIWLDRLTAEHDNLRAATAWAIEAGDVDIALRLGAASWRFWQTKGHLDEGRALMSRILAMPGAALPSPLRVRALEAAGGLAWWAADLSAADSLYAEQLDIARRVGDRRAIADAAFNLAHPRFALSQDPAAVAGLRDEAVAIYGELGDERALARVDWTGVVPLMASGRNEEAQELMLALLRRFEALGDDFYVGMVTLSLGGVSIALGDIDGAWRWGLRAVLLQYEMGDVASITLELRAVALLCLAMERASEAALFNGIFEGLCRRHGVRPPVDPVYWMPFIGADEVLVAGLTDPRYAAEIARGNHMTVDEALDELLRFARAEGVGDMGTAGDASGADAARAAPAIDAAR